MVKAPTTRHVRHDRSPVTLDLSAEKIVQEPLEAASPVPTGSEAASAKAASAATISGTDKIADDAKSDVKSASEKTDAAKADASASRPAPFSPSGMSAQTGSQPSESKPIPSAGAASTGSSASSSPSPSPSTPPASSSKPFGTASSSSDKGAGTTPPPPPSGGSGGRTASSKGAGPLGLFAAALLGGVVALGGYWLLNSAGLLKHGGKAQVSATDFDDLRNQIDQLKEGQAKLSAASPSDTQDIASLRGAVQKMDQELSALQTQSGETKPAAADEQLVARLDALEKQVAEQPAPNSEATATPPVDLAPVTGRIESVEATMRNVIDANQLAEQRYNELQKTIADLSTKVEAEANDPRLNLAITASALKAAIDRGEPFATELDTYAEVAGDAPEIAQLRPLADAGVPTRAAIAADMSASASAMLAAANPPSTDERLVVRLWSSAKSLVEVRPVGADIEGNEPDAVIARLEAAVQAEDYPHALAEYDLLPQAAKEAGAPLIDKIRARMAADELVSKALGHALKPA